MELNYDKLVAELLVMSEDTVGFMRSSTSPNIYGWNDALLEDRASKIDFPDTVYIRANYKKILIRFFNFYLDGDLPEGDNYPATILDAIGIASCQKKNLWQQNPHATDRNYYSPNASKPTTVNASYGNKGRNNFIERVKQLCEELRDDNHVATADEHLIRSLAGFLALTLMAGAIKNENQLKFIFLKRGYLENLNTLVSWPEHYGFRSPAQTCLTRTIESMRKSLSHTSNLSTLAAQKFVESTVKTKEDAVVKYLDASLLAHTAGNGIGIIQMINELCEHFEVPWTRLKEYTSLDDTKYSWKDITEFYRTYEAEYGYKWARIIYDGYLRGLSQKDNLFLAYILQAVISKYQGPRVWEAEWSKQHRMRYQFAVDYGLALFNHLSSASDADSKSEDVVSDIINTLKTVYL